MKCCAAGCAIWTHDQNRASHFEPSRSDRIRSLTRERLRRNRDTSLKDLINEVLRRGLRDMASRPKPRKPFRTKSVRSDQVFDAGAVAPQSGYQPERPDQ